MISLSFLLIIKIKLYYYFKDIFPPPYLIFKISNRPLDLSPVPMKWVGV